MEVTESLFERLVIEMSELEYYKWVETEQEAYLLQLFSILHQPGNEPAKGGGGNLTIDQLQASAAKALEIFVNYSDFISEKNELKKSIQRRSSRFVN